MELRLSNNGPEAAEALRHLMAVATAQREGDDAVREAMAAIVNDLPRDGELIARYGTLLLVASETLAGMVDDPTRPGEGWALLQRVVIGLESDPSWGTDKNPPQGEKES